MTSVCRWCGAAAGCSCASRARLDEGTAVRYFFNAVGARWANLYREDDSLSHLDLSGRLAVAAEMLNGACGGVEGSVTVLDAGCGTGEAASRLAPARFKVFATDVSTVMVGAATEQYPSIRACAGNATALPFRDGSFDAVLSLGVLEYVPAFEQAIMEFRRVLKLGGTLIFSIPNRESLFRRLHRAERSLTRPLRRLRARMNGLAQQDSDLTRAFRHLSWSVGEAERLLAVSGFVLVEAKLVTYGWLFPKAEKWPINLAFCRWMNRHCGSTGSLAKRLGCTAVLWARRGLSGG